MSSTWSYSTGPYGARVRVYERTPGGPLQIEWSGEPGRALPSSPGIRCTTGTWRWSWPTRGSASSSAGSPTICASSWAPRSGGPSASSSTDTTGTLAWDTLSRIRAIRHLRTEDVVLEAQTVRFLAKWDKRVKDAVVPISSVTAWKVRQLLQDRRVQETGSLFPSPYSSSEPLGYQAMKELLRDVEEAAGVEQVKRRLWHGLKRRGATEAEKRTGRRSAVSRQARTTEKVLERIYEQDDLEPKLEGVEALTDARTA